MCGHWSHKSQQRNAVGVDWWATILNLFTEFAQHLLFRDKSFPVALRRLAIGGSAKIWKSNWISYVRDELVYNWLWFELRLSGTSNFWNDPKVSCRTLDMDNCLFVVGLHSIFQYRPIRTKKDLIGTKLLGTVLLRTKFIKRWTAMLTFCKLDSNKLSTTDYCFLNFILF